jgi:tRNA (guanine37-N1)-methyltransferase
MRFDVVTLFPAMFAAITEHGITRRAHELGLWSLTTWNPRDFTTDAHRTVDDRPYGGGPGMVMMAEPLAQAVEAVRQDGGGACVVALAPAGRPLTDAMVRRWAGQGGSLAIVCGRYEGIDRRFLDECVDEEVSVGDFVMSGGELAAMALIDAVVRQLPGALKEASAEEESFATGLLDAPHYTRPEVWRGRTVPQVLLSGRHRDIEAWRRREALRATLSSRPEMIRAARAEARLSERDEKDLRELAQMGAAEGTSAA